MVIISFVFNNYFGLPGGKYERREPKQTLEPFPNITKEQFKGIVLLSIKPMKIKLREVSIADTKIYGTVISQGNTTEWDFVSDFNEYGKPTGNYQIETENKNLLIPNRIATLYRNKI